MLHDDTKSHCIPRDISINLRGMNESIVLFLIIEKTTKPYLGHRQLRDTLLPSPREVNHILWMLFYWSTKLSGERMLETVTWILSQTCDSSDIWQLSEGSWGWTEGTMKQSQKDLRIFNKETEMSLISLQGAGQSPWQGWGRARATQVGVWGTNKASSHQPSSGRKECQGWGSGKELELRNFKWEPLPKCTNYFSQCSKMQVKYYPNNSKETALME